MSHDHCNAMLPRVDVPGHPESQTASLHPFHANAYVHSVKLYTGRWEIQLCLAGKFRR